MHIKKMGYLLLAILISFFNNATCVSVKDVYLPQDVLVLQLPSNEAADWKAISRKATDAEAIAEYIPVTQNSKDWVDLIGIQYINFANENLGSNAIEGILNKIEQTTKESYPGSEVTWNVIEKKPNEAIYEWILHSKSGNIPPQHEIVHIFFHKNNFHRIGFTHKNEPIPADRRKAWIKRLSDSVSFISITNPNFPDEQLSLVTRVVDLIDLGTNFKDWKIQTNWMFKNNLHVFKITPPVENENSKESLDIGTLPKSLSSYAASITEFFDAQKNMIKKDLGLEPKIDILEKSPREIVFTYQHPKDNLVVTEIIRLRAAPQVDLGIYYKKFQKTPLSKEEILAKKKLIETIKYKSKK